MTINPVKSTRTRIDIFINHILPTIIHNSDWSNKTRNIRFIKRSQKKLLELAAKDNIPQNVIDTLNFNCSNVLIKLELIKKNQKNQNK